MREEAPSPVAVVKDRRSLECYIIGVDLAQANDFTAISILEKCRETSSTTQQKGHEPPTTTAVTRNVFHLRHLQRLKPWVRRRGDWVGSPNRRSALAEHGDQT